MQFELSIEAKNNAFHAIEGEYEPGMELARLLRKIADEVEDDPYGNNVSIIDIDGNRVGAWQLGPRP